MCSQMARGLSEEDVPKLSRSAMEFPGLGLKHGAFEMMVSVFSTS